jgi:hypothetical protein
MGRPTDQPSVSAVTRILFMSHFVREGALLEYQDKTVQEVSACTCDECHKHMTLDDPEFELKERLSVAFRGGCGSIFGDGSEVRLDLCQQCVKETLGAWLRIEHDPKTVTTGTP